MPDAQISIIPDYNFTSCDVNFVNGSEVWVTPSAIVCQAGASEIRPPLNTVTIDNVAGYPIGTTSITVEALPVALYAFDVLYFPTDDALVVLDADVAAAATTITCFATQEALTDDSEAQTYGMIPVFSANSATKTIGGNTINTRLFSSPIWEFQRSVSKNFNLAIAGERVTVDPGTDQLEALARSIDFAYVEFRQPRAQGLEKGYACGGTINDSTDTHAVDTNQTISYTLVGAGALEDYQIPGLT